LARTQTLASKLPLNLFALGVSKLIFAVRSLEKGEAAKLEIERKTKCNAEVIQLFKLDMSSYESIENFVKEVNVISTAYLAILLLPSL
jgi:short-subunit dehydrogenase